ncbi:hypothetical protein LAUMK40_05769 [Mycobacterium kansasii]|uniref:hypothetical protein n=1 Tax=Mycobacterium kansasii TaxID=1768 RepID=UPI000F160246|nr:hypothetical protein [Mycobacterium kansasii]VAZ69606.1 hypothetical protein LAUMK40_05769 [Mycobacterium kansasii]
MNLEVSESRDDLEAVVDGVAAASTLSQYLPIFEPDDDVLDAGADAAVLPVVGIVDDQAGVVALWVLCATDHSGCMIREQCGVYSFRYLLLSG